MNRITIACGLCLVMLAGSPAQSAPRRGASRRNAGRRSAGRAKAKAPAPKAAPVSELSVTEASATDIRGFGTVTKWTLRSNGTVVREGNHAGRNMGNPGDAYREHGTFSPGDFEPLAAFLESSRLLDIKAPAPQEMEGTTTVSIVRGSKRREIVVPDSASPASSASSGAWAAVKLVRGILADVDWRNDKGFSISTGLHVQFLMPREDLDADFHGDFPSFSVRNAAGKEVAVALVESEDLGIRQPLPPGTYTIVPSTPAGATPDARGLAWRPSQPRFEIAQGAFTEITIALEKAPATP